MAEGINRSLLLVLDKVAQVSDKVITQLKVLSEYAVEDFSPPVPAGETPLAMRADAHFATFVAVFMETLEYGLEGAQSVYKNRVSDFRGELEAVQKLVEIYLRHHFSNLTPYSAKVRELLLKAINGGLKDAMTALATQAGVLFRKCPYAAPSSGTGVSMTTPSFT